MQECNEFLVTKLKHFAQLVIPTGNRSLDVIDMSVEVLEVNDKTQPPGLLLLRCTCIWLKAMTRLGSWR